MAFAFTWFILLLISRGTFTAALSRVQPKPFRALEIKARLRRLGISTAGCFEKDELLRLLLEHAPEAAGVGHCVPLELLRAMDGAMGKGISVDAKRYAGIRFASADDAAVADSRLLMILDSAASNSLITPAASRLLGARPTGIRATADTGTATGLVGFEQANVKRTYPHVPRRTHTYGSSPPRM